MKSTRVEGGVGFSLAISEGSVRSRVRGNDGKADFISILKKELSNNYNFLTMRWTPSEMSNSLTRQQTSSEER